MVDVVKESHTLTGLVIAAKEGRVTFRDRTILDAIGKRGSTIWA